MIEVVSIGLCGTHKCPSWQFFFFIFRASHVHGSDPSAGWGTLCVVIVVVIVIANVIIIVFVSMIFRASHVHGSDPSAGWGALCVVNEAKSNCDHCKHLDNEK